MGKFKVFVVVLLVATVILAIAMAYVCGVTLGVQSQQSRLWKLEEELRELQGKNPWHVTRDCYNHPLLSPLTTIALNFGVCWIAVAGLYVVKQKPIRVGKRLGTFVKAFAVATIVFAFVSLSLPFLTPIHLAIAFIAMVCWLALAMYYVVMRIGGA